MNPLDNKSSILKSLGTNLDHQYEQPDRRLQKRYPLELDLQYRILDGAEVVTSGAGTTKDISSGGVFFRVARRLPSGPAVELSIRWPALQEDAPPVELCVFGRVVRNESSGAAVRVNRYCFRSSP